MDSILFHILLPPFPFFFFLFFLFFFFYSFFDCRSLRYIFEDISRFSSSLSFFFSFLFILCRALAPLWLLFFLLPFVVFVSMDTLQLIYIPCQSDLLLLSRFISYMTWLVALLWHLM